MARMIGRMLLTLAVLAVAGFVLLVLIGLWDRYEQETAALGFSGIYERYSASQADFSSDPKIPAGAEAARARQGAVDREQLTPGEFFQQGPKLVGTGAVGSTDQGMSVALSADGNTAIVGGPGATTRTAIGRLPPALLGRRGCSGAAVVSGDSKAASLSAPPANMEVIVVARCVRRALRRRQHCPRGRT